MPNARILIVEDTVSSMVWLAELISQEGYHVSCAKSGSQALQLLETLIPDLILLDVSMPDMDGLELCKRIRQKPGLQSVPIIFQSVSTDSATKIEGLKAGAADFVSKPYQPEEILLRVRTHLELHRLQTSLQSMVEERTQQLQAEVRERQLAEQELIVSQRELRELGAHLQNVREEERRRIAREIHDALGQSLTVAQIELKRLEASIKEGRPDSGQLLGGLRTSISEAADIARSISENLRPGMLDLLGLKPALEHYLQQFSQATGIECRANFNLNDELEIEERHAIAIFRIAQESLTNVARHAKASEVSVQLMGSDEGLILAVQDDGIGTSEADQPKPGRFGLQGMRERAEMLGGNLTLDTGRGFGTRVEAFLPLQEFCVDD